MATAGGRLVPATMIPVSPGVMMVRRLYLSGDFDIVIDITAAPLSVQQQRDFRKHEKADIHLTGGLTDPAPDT